MCLIEDVVMSEVGWTERRRGVKARCRGYKPPRWKFLEALFTAPSKSKVLVRVGARGVK